MEQVKFVVELVGIVLEVDKVRIVVVASFLADLAIVVVVVVDSTSIDLRSDSCCTPLVVVVVGWKQDFACSLFVMVNWMSMVLGRSMVAECSKVNSISEGRTYRDFVVDDTLDNEVVVEA